MPRNAEVIRQWSILRALESSRRLTIDEMAETTGVSTRTIRRDLEALQYVGFPIYDEVYDGKRFWLLEQLQPHRLDFGRDALVIALVIRLPLFQLLPLALDVGHQFPKALLRLVGRLPPCEDL